MPRPPHWHNMVESSREEALNAVEFCNRPAGRRPLEAFLVHMHIAWLYLFQAEFERDGINYFYRDPKRPERYVRVDGEKKAWELERCVKQRWPDSDDPVRKNLELTIRLRNKIEHRHEAGLTVAAAGFTQALVLNYEEELVAQFGARYSLADVVHVPVSLNAYTREGAARLAAAQSALPKGLKNFFVGFRSGLPEDVRDDRRFEYRVELVQKRAPRTEADLAVSFVREDELTAEELAAYEALERTGRVILREKHRPVANLGLVRPKALCEQVEARIPFRFRHSAEFPRAWKKLGVRPLTTAKGKDRLKTDQRYCVYDEAHDDYVYTDAFVSLLADRCETREGFVELIGREPRERT